MKVVYKVWALLFAVLALCAAGAGVYLALENVGSEPQMVQAPEEARQRALTLLDALCEGNYSEVSSQLYGQPELGLDKEPADEVGVLLWAALTESRSYEILRDCYATDSGIAMDVAVEGLDLQRILNDLRQQSQMLLEQRVSQAEDASEIYDENGEYREDFVMEVLENAVREVMAWDSENARWELTLQFVYDEGRWWIRPDEMLLSAISGGTNK